MTANVGASPLAIRLLPGDRALRFATQVGLVLIGTLMIALSAKIRVPLGPVDMSLQTLAVYF